MEFPVVSSLPFVLFGCAPPSIRPIFVANPFFARERDAQHPLGPHARPCRKGGLLMYQELRPKKMSRHTPGGIVGG